MDVGEIGGILGSVSAAVGAAWAAYAHLAKKIEESRAGINAEQAAFIKTTLEREEHCRKENHELRNELTMTNARLLVVERSAMLAEVHLEVRGKLDQVLAHFGIAPAIVPPPVEVLTNG